MIEDYPLIWTHSKTWKPCLCVSLLHININLISNMYEYCCILITWVLCLIYFSCLGHLFYHRPKPIVRHDSYENSNAIENDGSKFGWVMFEGGFFDEYLIWCLMSCQDSHIAWCMSFCRFVVVFLIQATMFSQENYRQSWETWRVWKFLMFVSVIWKTFVYMWYSRWLNKCINEQLNNTFVCYVVMCYFVLCASHGCRWKYVGRSDSWRNISPSWLGSSQPM